MKYHLVLLLITLSQLLSAQTIEFESTNKSSYEFVNNLLFVNKQSKRPAKILLRDIYKRSDISSEDLSDLVIFQVVKNGISKVDIRHCSLSKFFNPKKYLHLPGSAQGTLIILPEKKMSEITSCLEKKKRINIWCNDLSEIYLGFPLKCHIHIEKIIKWICVEANEPSNCSSSFPILRSCFKTPKLPTN